MYKMAISMQYYATGLGYNVTPKSFSEEPADSFHQIIIISFQLSSLTVLYGWFGIAENHANNFLTKCLVSVTFIHSF